MIDEVVLSTRGLGDSTRNLVSSVSHSVGRVFSYLPRFVHREGSKCRLQTPRIILTMNATLPGGGNKTEELAHLQDRARAVWEGMSATLGNAFVSSSGT